MSDIPEHLRGATIMTPADRLQHALARAERLASAPPPVPAPAPGPMTVAERVSLREWLASWGDGPNRIDATGQSVPIAKVTLTRLLDELDRRDPAP